jgi:hypothetical protein
MEQFISEPNSAKGSVMKRFQQLREEMNQFSLWCRENSVTVDDQASEIAFLYLKMAEIKEDIQVLFKNI